MTFSDNSRLLISTFALVLACGDDGSATTTGADSESSGSGTQGTTSSTSGATTSSTSGTSTATSADSTGMATGETSADATAETTAETTAGSTGESTAGATEGGTAEGSTGSATEGSSGGGSGDTGAVCCDPGDIPEPPCIEGASCCSDGTWMCNEGGGQAPCDEGVVCEEPLCCDPDMMMICFEGTSCCDDGTWQCNDEMGEPTCKGDLGEVCENNMCGGVQDDCFGPNDPPCCEGLECCVGVPVPPGDEYCAQICPISDRNKKENFATVDASAVLQKVVEMPITTWSYTFEDSSVRHIGPMAQDFKAAFEVGATDKAIFQVDADGVALASIQALAAELATVKDENARLKGSLAAMERRLAQLEKGK
jgi:hypothetical protein